MFRPTTLVLAALIAALGCAREKKDQGADDRAVTKTTEQAAAAANNTEATKTEASATEPTLEVPEMPAVGTAAPAFTTVAHDGTEIDVAKLRGETFVLYFYPRDETPG